MASCGAEFSLLNDDDNHQHHHSNHRHHHQNLQHHQSFPPPHRFVKPIPLHSLAPVPLLQEIHANNGAVGGNRSVGNEDDDDEDFNGATFCSQADPKCTSTFHDVTPFSGEDNVNQFVDESDPEKSMLNARNERKERDEVSDGGTPYMYKKQKLASGGSSGAGTSSGDYRKDREEWSDTAITCLLDAYMDKFTQLNRGNLRGRDWEEVAITVSERCDKMLKSVEQCKNKVDNLKKRYKLERHRMTNGGISASHWPWFKKMEQIVGNSLPSKNIVDEDKSVVGSGSSIRPSKRSTTATSSPVAQITNMKSKSLSNPKWRRVVFKISGAALAGTGPNNIDPKVAMLIAREVAVACRLGVEVAIVVGGRNFFCGDTWVTATGLDRCTAYQIGMMATVMNSILLQSAIEKMGIQTRLQSAFTMQEVAEPYSRQRAIRHLEKGRVVIFGGVGAGTGNPLFSTDTAAALRASEKFDHERLSIHVYVIPGKSTKLNLPAFPTVHAEAVLKGTNVDGVYDCNSRNNNIIFQQISFRELVSRGATSMDMMAMTFCEENGIPVVVFNLLEPGNISRALCGDQVGTLINETGRIS